MNSYVEETLQSEPFRSFLATWQSLRVGNKLPSRGKIHLRDFVDHLENLIIYERFGPRDLRYRLTGSGVSERVDNIGVEVNLFDLFVPEVHDACEIWWNAVMDAPCGGIMEFSTAFTNGNHRAGMAIALPILSQRGTPLLLALNHMMGIIRVSEPRAQVAFGVDYAIGHYFDIGYGVPPGGTMPVVGKAKPLESGGQDQTA